MRLKQVVSDYIRRSILTTQGDLVVRGAAQPERLAAGADRTYFRGRGAGVIPAYEAEPVIPACRVTLGASQLLVTGGFRRLQLDTIGYDTASNFNIVTHMWVCNDAGIYLVCANVGINTLGDGVTCGLMIRINSAFSGGFTWTVGGAATDARIGASDIFSLSVNDEIDLTAYHNHGTSRWAPGGTAYMNYMAIHRLS